MYTASGSSVMGQSTYSREEEEEPWDQYGSGSSSLRGQSNESDIRAASFDEPGELVMGGRMINGQRTTKRPLSPPSAAGTRQFWNQMEEEEGPDDEVAAYKREVAELQQMSSETIEDMPEDPYCGQALTAISEICGGGGLNRISDAKTSQHKEVQAEDPVEEQTAIEVEYVEPLKTMSPQRKNAYLTAMARKARSSFRPNQKTKSPAAISPETAKNEDVYATFSPPEKRKFLKLINEGMPAQQASEVVAQDRNGGQPNGDQGGSPTRRSKRLAFWKANNQHRGLGPNRASKADKKSNSPSKNTPPRKNNARNTAAVAAVAGSAAVAAVAATTREEQSYDTRAVTISPDRAEAEEYEEVEALHTNRTPSAEADSFEDEMEDDDNNSDFESGEEELPMAATRSSDEEEAFKRSGINYYDGIRREEDDDLEEEVMMAASVPRKEANRMKGMKTRSTPRWGFAELKDQNNRNPKRVEPVQSRGLPAAKLMEPGQELGMVAAAAKMSKDFKEHKVDDQADIISAKDASVMEKIERELTRPVKVPESSGGAEPISNEAKALAAFVAQAQPFSDESTLPPPPPRPQTEEKGSGDRSAVVDDDDMDMDTYMSSTDFYSPGGGGDNMSVYSAGTGVTGQSGITQSSRVRRPGAAKGRLKRAKGSGESKPKGWYDSIRAAAKNANQKWDPEKGWVDYHEPDVDLSGEVPATERDGKLHLDLSRTIRREKDDGDENGDSSPVEPVEVPFPEEWEEDRSTMLSEHGEATERALSEINVETTAKPVGLPARRSRSAPRGGTASSRQQENESSHRPQGWVASMKAASAALGKEGRTWDPVKGWTALEDNDGVVPDVVDFDSESKGGQENETNPSTSNAGKERALNHPVLSTDSSTDPYLQLGESGDVDKLEKTPLSDHSEDDDHAVSVGSEGAFPSFGSQVVSAVTTGVIRERVGDEDMNLFQESQDPRPRELAPNDSGSGPVDLDENFNDEDEPEDDQPAQAPTENPSPRRGDGPVDLDESHGEISSSEDEAQAWDATSNPLAKLVGEASVSSSLPMKRVPKLGASKKDTSKLQRETIESSHLGTKQELIDRYRAQTSDSELRPRQPDISSSPVVRGRAGGYDATQKLTPLGLAAKLEKPALVTPPSARGLQLAEDEDSLFEFVDQKSLTSQPPEAPSEVSDLERSNLSPISPQSDDQEDSIVYGSEAYGPDVNERKSFFSRIAECAAPSVPASRGAEVPRSHLNFLQDQARMGICARPDSVDDGSRELEEPSKPAASSVDYGVKQTESVKRTKSSASSVISDDGFGAKTAYLDAIAMKTAVSKPKRSSSRNRGSRSGASTVSSGSSHHSERWKTYIERKKQSQDADASKVAAEKYASRQVDEMMSSISQKGLRDAEKSSTVEAAEDLAAARVEAMMSALSTPVEEGEI